MTDLSNVVDQFGVYIYKNPLIWFKVETFTNWKHRELTVMKDPRANSYICSLTEELLTENPIFSPEILTGNIAKEWLDEGWLDLLVTLIIAARTHSWCIVQLYDRKPYWKVFTWRELVEMKYDKNDNPIGAKVEWDNELIGANEWRSHKETLNFKRDKNEKTKKFSALFIPFGTKTGKNLGKYDLEAIWDLIVYIRYQELDIINNSAKSSGFYRIVYGSAIKEDQKQDLIDGMDYAGMGQAIGAKKTVLEDIVSHFPEHPEFTVTAMDETLNLLAGTTRLPLSFFKGEKDGGGVFQEGFSDEAKITKKKKYIFGQFKKAIIELVKMRWGKVVEDVEPYIEEEVMKDTQMEQEAEGQFKDDHLSDKKPQKPSDKKIA